MNLPIFFALDCYLTGFFPHGHKKPYQDMSLPFGDCISNSFIVGWKMLFRRDHARNLVGYTGR